MTTDVRLSRKSRRARRQLVSLARAMVDSLLERVTLFEGVSVPHRELIERAATRQVLQRGEVLIRQGELTKAMHFILRGTLGVALNEATADPIAVVQTGETVGELPVLTGETASAFVTAVEEAEVLSLDEGAAWEVLQASHPPCSSRSADLAQRRVTRPR
jgi:CRP-like cAMP-binding protein